MALILGYNILENESAAGAKGYKQLSVVTVSAPIVHGDGDDHERSSVFCTHRTRGFLRASAFTLTNNSISVLKDAKQATRSQLHW